MGWPEAFADTLNEYLQNHEGCRPALGLDTVMYSGHPFLVGLLRHVCPKTSQSRTFILAGVKDRPARGGEDHA